MVTESRQSDEAKSNENDIEEGDILHNPDVDEWEEMFSANADRYGNIRNVLYETPDGRYVHVSYPPARKAADAGDRRISRFSTLHRYSIWIQSIVGLKISRHQC